MPWQQHVVDVALEHDADGRYVYDEVDLTVPRQSGKTVLLLAVMVQRCVMAQRQRRSDTWEPWGRQRVTYTAQARNAAKKKLELDFADILRGSRSFVEVTNPKARTRQVTSWKLSLNNGSERIQFGRGNYLQIDAPTKKAGHGDTLDLGVIDEAFAHAGDDVEQAMRPAQSTRWNPQIWAVSTAGDDTSFYLWRKVKAGREACESGQHGRVAYFEWSIPPDADIDDEDVWWEHLPALGQTISVDFVRAELERCRRNHDEGEAGWRRPYGNQWVKVPVLSTDPAELPIPRAAWELVSDRRSVAADGPRVFAADASMDRRWSSIAVACHNDRGMPHVELVERQGGVMWMVPRLVRSLEHGPVRVQIDSRSPARSIVTDLEAAGVDVDVVPEGTVAARCGAFADAVKGRALVYRPINDPELGDPDAAMTAALVAARKRPVGDGWAWSRRDSASDITPLVAATLAFGALPAASGGMQSMAFVL